MALAIIWLVLFVIWIAAEILVIWPSQANQPGWRSHGADAILTILIGILGWVVLVQHMAR